MNLPDDLFYTETHEWISVDGQCATVGITDHAQSELGDIIFVELPDAGAEVARGEPFGTIEAVKTVADLFAPLSGKITDANISLDENPEKVNEDPYGEGWIVKIELSDPSEKETLLSADEYTKIIN